MALRAKSSLDKIALPVVALLILLVAMRPSGAQAASNDYLAQAHEAINFKRYHYAVDLTTQAIRQNPSDTEAYYFRALSYGILQQNELAVADFEKASKMKPCKICVVLNEVAKSYIALEKDDQALSLLDTAISVFPFSDSYRSKGQILWRRRQSAQAIACFDKAIKVDPRNYWNYDDRAKCLQSLGRFADALKDVNKMVELQPTAARNYSIRAVLYEKLGNKAAAKKDRERSNSLSPQEWF